MSSTVLPAVVSPSKLAKSKSKSIRKTKSKDQNNPTIIKESVGRRGLVPILPKLAPRSSLNSTAAPETIPMDVLGQCMREFLLETNQQSYFYQYPSALQMPLNYFSSNAMYMQPHPNYYNPEQFNCLPPPPSSLNTLLPTLHQQKPLSGSYMLGVDGIAVMHQQLPIQPPPHPSNETGKYFHQLKVSTNNPTIAHAFGVNQLGNVLINGVCHSNSSGILPSSSSSQTTSSIPPLTCSDLPSTACMASSLSSLAASLGLCDRFSPSSSSSASVDSGFAEITSFPSSPDSVSSNQGKSSAFSQPQSSSSQSLLMLKDAPVNFSHLNTPKIGTESFLTVKNMPLQLPVLQNPLNLYGSADSEKCDQPANKVRRIQSQGVQIRLATAAHETETKSAELMECNLSNQKSSPEQIASTSFDAAYIIETHQIKMEQDFQKNTAIELEETEKERSVPLLEPEPRIEESCNPLILASNKGQFPCGWASCQEHLATDNQLFDHVVKEHLEKLRPVVVADEQKSQQTTPSTRLSRRRRNSNTNSANNTQKGKNNKEKEKEDKFCCKWKDCEMFLQRGDNQKQFDWLLDHYTTRHAPRAQPFVCLFAQCSLRFRIRRSLNDHLRCAHDNVRITGKKNGSVEENKAFSSCFGFRPRVQIPPRIDCMDTRTMEWVRDQLKQFNQMQKPCLINEQQPVPSSRKINLLNNRAQFRKTRRYSTQFLMEFDKILSFKRSICNGEALTKLPEISVLKTPVDLDTNAKKMTVNETVNLLSSIFKQHRKQKG